MAIFLITGSGIALWVVMFQSADARRHLVANWHLGAIGGVGMIASYGLGLWAMTSAPIAIVAALRETSILFGVAISGLVLKERIDRFRIASAGIIAAGAIVLRLG